MRAAPDDRRLMHAVVPCASAKERAIEKQHFMV